MTTRLLFLAAVFLWPTAVHAEDCKIEDWKWSAPIPNILIIEGVSTCETGRLTLRLYEGDGGAFIGVETAFIRGFAFKAMRTATAKPSALTIKYTIKRR